MTLEHYPSRPSGHLTRIAPEAMARFALIDALIIHGVGALAPVASTAYPVQRQNPRGANGITGEDPPERAV